MKGVEFGIWNASCAEVVVDVYMMDVPFDRFDGPIRLKIITNGSTKTL